MATIAALRERSTTLFTDLARAQARAPRRRTRGAAAAPREYSWFEPADARAAAALAFRLAALAASRARVNDALEVALDHAEESRSGASSGEVFDGLALFVIHNVVGRRLAKPRTVAAAPRLFRPPPAGGGHTALSIGGLAPGLDYWREDALHNEHHQHWHQVYPYVGLPPRDFAVWAADTSRPDMVEMLETMFPGQGWEAQVAGASVAQLATFFAQVARRDEVDLLPARLFRLMFRLNDRQGELFFYMHEQMLARYDAELASNGLDRVRPFGPAQWVSPILEGYDPDPLQGFGKRLQNRTISADGVTLLRSLQGEIDDALDDGKLDGRGGAVVAIDRTNLGEAVESTAAQLRELDEDRYRGLHNAGHGLIANITTPGGVMRSTVTAIRDQVFWRWHKHIDDINAGWQDAQPVQAFTDAPAVVLRNSLAPAAATPWASPDVILCRTSDLQPGADADELFGGDRWDTDFTAVTMDSVQTIDTLTTMIASVTFGGRKVAYLTHEPFTAFLRIENPGATARDVTVRMFLAPAATARDRRAWIELDKFPVHVPGRTKLVVRRDDTESSVVKRPVDRNPARALGQGSGPTEDSYCDCGWPWTLLLPRGTTAGMSHRLMAICTDAATDRVPEQGNCGSMSYCGAVDRYPDTRDMGYPFARRFPGPAATAIRDTITGLGSAAARTVTIRHA